jgi:hypothetical protein
VARSGRSRCVRRPGRPSESALAAGALEAAGRGHPAPTRANASASFSEARGSAVPGTPRRRSGPAAGCGCERHRAPVAGFGRIHPRRRAMAILAVAVPRPGWRRQGVLRGRVVRLVFFFLALRLPRLRGFLLRLAQCVSKRGPALTPPQPLRRQHFLAAIGEWLEMERGRSGESSASYHAFHAEPG